MLQVPEMFYKKLTSPVNFDCLTNMKLLIDIQFKLAGEQGFVWQIIKNAIESKSYSQYQLLYILKDMAIDNYKACADVLGVELTDKILAL